MKNEQDKNPENTHTTEPSEHVNSSDNGALKDGARSQDEYANGTPLIRTSPLRSHRRQQEEPWPEPVDGRALLDALCRVLGRFVVLPPWAQEVLALWTLHTYAFELRDITTYIGIESPEKRCGKTTLLTLLSELVNRPEAAANISSPAFFRTIEEMRPTLLIDESDTHLKGNHQLRGILNSGYNCRMSYVLRVTHEKEDTETRGHGDAERGPAEEAKCTNPLKSKIRNQKSKMASRLARFSCWCPKAIATIGHLPETLADRCLRIRMQRKTGAENCERFDDDQAKALAPLRRQCARFVQDHAAEIASARPSIPAGLNDRAADISAPLLVLADLAGGEWPKIARDAVVGLTERAEESNPIGALLLDIFVLFARLNADRLFTRTVVAELNSWRERPWAEMLHGKEVNDLWLARTLRPYGIRPKTIWIGDEHAKGYVQEECKEVFRRYISKSEWEALKAEWLTAKPDGSNPAAEDASSGDKAESAA